MNEWMNVSVFIYCTYSRIPITRTFDNSNLSLTWASFHFPSSNFVYNFTLDNSNNVFQDVTSKTVDLGYSPTGRSVLGKIVPEVLDTSDTLVLKTGVIIFPVRTDLGWWVRYCLFFPQQNARHAKDPNCCNHGIKICNKLYNILRADSNKNRGNPSFRKAFHRKISIYIITKVN